MGASAKPRLVEQVGVYQAGREILASGSTIVVRCSAPLVVTYGSDSLVIHFDVTAPHTLPNGLVVGGRHDANSIAPDEDKTAAVGEASVSYSLQPIRPDLNGPDPAGRYGPTMWLLIWEVWRDAAGMAIPAPVEPNWGMQSRDPSSYYG